MTCYGFESSAVRGACEAVIVPQRFGRLRHTRGSLENTNIFESSVVLFPADNSPRGSRKIGDPVSVPGV